MDSDQATALANLRPKRVERGSVLPSPRAVWISFHAPLTVIVPSQTTGGQ
jgi:hypothetical protein